MLAFFLPGPIEVIIIGVFLLVLVAIVALVISLTHNRKASPTNPNLKPCPDCGRFVSLRATNCPQCGNPIQTQQ